MPTQQDIMESSVTGAAEAAHAAMKALASNDLVTARQDAERALALRDDGSPSAWALAHRCLAMVHWREEEPARCRDHFAEEARLLGEMKPPDMERLLGARDDVALLDYKLGHFAAALAMREETRRLAESDPSVSPVLRRRLERRLAQSLQRHGAMNAAEQLYARAKPASTDSYGDQLGWHTAVALLAEQRGDISTAASRYDEMLAFLEAHGDQEGHDEALANVILTRLDLGEDRRVATLLRNLRCSVRGVAGRLRLLDVRTVLLQGRGRFAAAAAVAAQADRLMAGLVSADHEDLVNRAAVRAAMLRAAGRRSEAKALVLARLPGKPTPGATAALIELGEMLVEEGAYVQALSTLELALAGEAGQDFAEARWRTLLALSDAAVADGKPKAGLLLGKMALEPVRQTAASLSGESRGGWMRSRAAAYDRVLDRLALAGRLPEAAVLQLRRLQEASREIGFRRPELERTLSPVPYRPGEAALRARYDDLQRAAVPRSDAREDIASWLADVLAQDLDAPAEYTPRQPWGTALWLLAGNGRARAVLADAAGGTHEYPIPMTPEELARGVRALREAIVDRSDDWADISRRLRQAIFGAVTGDLGGLQRLDLVAPGVFAFVPFAALHDGRSFLVERFELALRTGQPGRPPATSAPKAWQVAALGASVARPGLEPLPGVHDELVQLAAFSGFRSRIDADFTAASLREELAAAPQLVHVASHFHFQPARPHLSTLALGDGTALPIAALSGPEYDFSAVELLVLAACDTGVSDSLDMGVEGLAGLAQAKGAGTVVASLWQVPDTGTARVMSRFYAELREQQHADAAAALAAAQRAMIADGTATMSSTTRAGGIGGGRRLSSAWHPIDWAGFAVFVAEPAASDPGSVNKCQESTARHSA